MRVVVPPVVRIDIRDILSATLESFGPTQVERYGGYIESIIEQIGRNPLWIASRKRDDIAVGLRSIHLSAAAQRRSAAAYVVFYRQILDEAGEPTVLIVRILHERADPVRNLA